MEDATTDGDTYFGNKFIQDSGGDLGEIRGDITDIFLYNGGSGYNSLPTVSVEPSSAGSSAILKTFGEEIGRILDLNLVELGINHQLSPTPPTLNLFKNCIVTNVSGSFSTGNTVTLTGGVTATVVSFNNPRGLLILKDNSGLINVGDTVTGPLGSAVIKKLDPATATLAVGSIADTDGVFINEDGFISENTMRIQDSLLYQDFSYIIKVGRSIADWRDNFKKTIHTSGFYFIGQVEIDSRINARISIPITGAVSGVIDEPFYNVINTLFSKVFGRRLGTVDDGTSLRTNPKLGADVDFLTETISPFSSTTRDVTLVRAPIKIDYLSRVREKFNGVTISTGFVYGGPRYQTINREIFKTFGISGTNYSFEELSKNVTFGTKSAFDGLDNTFFFSSTNTGRMLKTKLTMPAFIDIAVPENVFDNTKTTFDQLIDNNSNPITFDDTTP